MTGAPRLDSLTGLRGIAAWFVVFYHIRYSLTGLLPDWAIGALGKGYLAVDLFFMLSGFVLWLNYAGKLAEGGGGAVRRFWWRRFARIWPLHALVLGGFMALAALLAMTGRDASGYPLAQLPLHLLLVQNWGFTRELAWNHPAWSISTEAAAYLMFPALVLVQARRPAGAATMLAAMAVLLAALHFAFALTGRQGLGAGIAQMGLARCLIEFTLGAVAARLWLLWRDAPARGGAGRLIPGGLALAGGAVAGAGAGAGALWGWPETAFVPLAFLCALMALALDRGWCSRVLGRGPLLYLGEISYSTYLAHYGLFIVFKLVAVDASLQLGWGRLGAFLALLLAVSAALYHGVEKPAQRWLNAWGTRATRPEPVAALP